MNYLSRRALLLLLSGFGLTLGAALSAGCAGSGPPPQTTIVVPSAATSAPEYRGDGSIPPQRYVIRMSDGSRDWEVEFPEVARGYEVRIPLRDERDVRPAHVPLTRADQELIEHLRRTNPDFEREGVFIEGEHSLDRQARREGAEPRERSGQRPETDPAPTRPSYFRGIEHVRELYQAGRLETAMIHLAELEQAYPNDVQILTMKGSLWLELGNDALARQAWEQVLQIEPDNDAVIRAIDRLDGGGQLDD